VVKCLRKQEVLISRLNAIGSSLTRSNKPIALIGLGSVGVEVDRLDDYSDLDFFGVVEPGFKNEFLDRTTAQGFAECLTPRRIENLVGSAEAS